MFTGSLSPWLATVKAAGRLAADFTTGNLPVSMNSPKAFLITFTSGM